MTIQEAIKLVRDLTDDERYPEALQLMTQMHEAHPTVTDFVVGLGVLHERMGNVPLAIVYYQRAVSMNPDDAMAHWALALSSLLVGDFERGWREFEWRLRVSDWTFFRGFAPPQWTGQQDINGKVVLLHAEGGHGDALQFSRYIPMVRQRGATVLIECQPGLVPMLGRLPAVTQTFRRGEPLPPFDYHCPLQSLPVAFGMTLEKIPRTIPYLPVDPARIEHWRQKLGPRGGFRVGLVWSGSDSVPYLRSRTLETFAPLAAVPGVEFHSLQTGPAAAQHGSSGITVIDHSSDLINFAETAALITQLDLVISVDTSVAHLAGAIGKQVWVLIPKRSDFRWMLNRTDSPWYPTMRLFRQSRQSKDWNPVVAEIVSALSQRIAQGPARPNA